MSRKVTVKKTKKTSGQTFDLSFNGLTAGEVLSIKNALELSGSPVASDVLAYLNNGVYDAPEDCKWLKDCLR
jgi:hypothetical protein